MTFLTNVDSSGMGVHDHQFRIARGYPSPQIPAFRTVHAAGLQPLESGHPSLRHCILLKSDSSDPGSARLAKENDRLSSGVEPSLFQGWLATNQCIAAAKVMLKDGHKAPNRFRP